MNNRFDELTKTMAQSVTRRQAMKKLGVGLAGMALACFGFANKAAAGKIDFCPGCIAFCMANDGLSHSVCRKECRQSGHCK